MKLFWKLFAGILTIIVFSFGIFGTVLLQSSFQGSLEREKERGMEEIRMFQYAFLTSLDGLTGNNYMLTDETIRALAESISQNMGDSSQSFGIYDADGESVYPDGQQAGELLPLMQAKKADEYNCVWRVAQESDAYRVEMLMRMEGDGQTYYLQMNRDITYVYENRELMYRNYRIAILLLSMVAAVFSALLAVSFTRPIYRLSQATRAFSNGDYDKRVTVKGDDELSLLMNDFNQMADQLQGNIQQLCLAARRQEEFTGAFAHELKTPLTSIIGYGQMLRTMDLPEEERRLAADYIYREGKRLERLAYKMLELIQMREETTAFCPVPMQKWGQDLERLATPMLAEKQICFSLDLDEGTVSGDWELLLSLFGNLVDNARKACRSGGTIAVEGCCLPDGSYRMRVTDDGCGMPKEELVRITEAFYRIDKSRSRKEGGVGLGMAICERIVVLHNAKWKIESEPEKGTQITVVFPAEEEVYENTD
jgi:signal transduction histidine kinase